MADSSLKMWYLKNMSFFKGANADAMKMLDDMFIMKTCKTMPWSSILFSSDNFMKNWEKYLQ